MIIVYKINLSGLAKANVTLTQAGIHRADFLPKLTVLAQGQPFGRSEADCRWL